MRRIRRNAPLACAIALAVFAGAGTAQSIRELQALQVPRELALSADGAELYFKLGPDYWKIATSWNAKAVRSAARPSAKAEESPEVKGTPRASVVMRSPDGAKIAYLDSARPATALNLFCRCDGESSDSRKVSDLPIRSYQWSSDSTSFWVLLSNGADIAFGRLSQDGRFKQMSSGAALRGLGGLAAASDVAAWVQSDSSHHGAIWIKDKADKVYELWDPNPQTTKWSEAWTQEVVHWRNAHGEELQGVLARPKGRSRVPLVVDPYSGWQNRFLNIGLFRKLRLREGRFRGVHSRPPGSVRVSGIQFWGCLRRVCKRP